MIWLAPILFSGFIGLPECYVHGDDGATVHWTVQTNRLQIQTDIPAKGSYECIGVDLDGNRKTAYGRFETEKR